MTAVSAALDGLYSGSTLRAGGGVVAAGGAARTGLELLGSGGQAAALPLLLRRALKGREMDLTGDLLRRLLKAQTVLEESWSAYEEGLAGEEGGLRREQERLAAQRSASGGVAVHGLDLPPPEDPAQRRLREIQRLLEGLRESRRSVAAARARLDWIKARLARELGWEEQREALEPVNAKGRGILSREEYAELLEDLIKLFEPRDPVLRREILEIPGRRFTESIAADFRDALTAFLSERSRARLSEPALLALRRIERLGVRASVHDGVELFSSPESAVIAVRLGGAVSVQRDALEHLVSPEGRRAMDAARPDLPRDEEGYLGVLAAGLAGEDPGVAEAAARVGTAGLESAFYSAHPGIEREYRKLPRWMMLTWVPYIGMPIVAVTLLDAFFADTWTILLHLGMLYAVVFSNIVGKRPWDRPWWKPFDRGMVLGDGGEAPMPLGLRPIAERVAERAGFKLGSIRISEEPEPRAWALPGRDGADLVLPRTLLERTFVRGESAALEGAIGHAFAHAENNTAGFLAFAGFGLFALVDAAVPLAGWLDILLWLPAAGLAYLATWKLFQRMERFADVAGARLSAKPKELAGLLREVGGAMEKGEIPTPRYGPFLPREPSLEERAQRLEDLSR